MGTTRKKALAQTPPLKSPGKKKKKKKKKRKKNKQGGGGNRSAHLKLGVGRPAVAEWWDESATSAA